jgi:dienelactone hydrolase
MNIGLLPQEHMHTLVNTSKPAYHYEGGDLAAWQKDARAKLGELLGMHEIEKLGCPLECEIEYDRYAEDLDCREIRIRFTTEENVTVPCHICIPKDAKKPLPVMIALQGHSTGMHISLGRPKYERDHATISGGDRDFAKRAVKEGIVAIAMEQRCFGECGEVGGTTNCELTGLRAIMLGRTIIGERVWDTMRLIDLLERDFKDIADTDKVICLGNSGGGTATIYAAAMDERIKIAVPSCAVCRYGDSIAAMAHCACNYVPYIAKSFDMGELCQLVAPRSLIVVNGVEDNIFPIAGAKACVEVAKIAYEKNGAADKLHHVIGEAGHRFYADDTWPILHGEIEKL